MKASFNSIPWWAAAIWIVACQPRQDNDYVVRVGSSVLTQALIDSAIGSTVRDNPALREAYIQNWVHDEIVYQKAVSEGLDKNPDFVRQMESLRRDVLVHQYLSDELDRSVTVSADDIQRYYEDNKSLFLCAEDQVKTEYFFTKDRARARKVAVQFGRLSRMVKRDFLDLVAQAAADSDITGAADFAGRDKFEPRAHRFLFARNAADEVAGPILTSEGYYALWHVVEYRLKGTPKGLDEVRNAIESRLRAIKRKKKTEEILKELRNDIPIEYANP